jgi:hypothetical protein
LISPVRAARRGDLAALLTVAKDVLRGDRGYVDDPTFQQAVRAAERAERTIKQVTRRRDAKPPLMKDGQEKVLWTDEAADWRPRAAPGTVLARLSADGGYAGS